MITRKIKKIGIGPEICSYYLFTTVSCAKGGNGQEVSFQQPHFRISSMGSKVTLKCVHHCLSKSLTLIHVTLLNLGKGRTEFVVLIIMMMMMMMMMISISIITIIMMIIIIMILYFITLCDRHLPVRCLERFRRFPKLKKLHFIQDRLMVR